tara:strand:- start:628 stop:1020 length:393 start_codon:yes stop_codon:yes gene_type:complete
MGIRKFFRKKTTEERTSTLEKLKKERIEREGTARLIRKEKKERGRIARAKRAEFEETPFYKTYAGFKKVKKQFKQTGAKVRKKAGGYGDTGFGITQEDLSFGLERPRKKRIRRQRPDDEMYGDLGTDRYW